MYTNIQVLHTVFTILDYPLKGIAPFRSLEHLCFPHFLLKTNGTMNYYLKRNDSIQTEKVMLLEALENYTLFHLNDGRKIISSLTLKRHQEKLEIEFFVRVNRSTIINKNFVKKILLKDRTNFIRLKNGKEIKVSRRRQDTLSQLAS